VTSFSFVSPSFGFGGRRSPDLLGQRPRTPKEASCAGEVRRTRDASEHWATVLSTTGPVLAVAANARRWWAVQSMPEQDAKLVIRASGEKWGHVVDRSSRLVALAVRIKLTGPTGWRCELSWRVLGKSPPSPPDGVPVLPTAVQGFGDRQLTE
jgi:hypothetical protein